MAGNPVIAPRFDPSQIIAGIKKVEAELDAMQARTSKGASSSGAGAIPQVQLPKSVTEQLVSPVVPAAARGGTVADNKARAQAIKDQARIVALKQEELVVNERIARRNPALTRRDPSLAADRRVIRDAGTQGLSDALGGLDAADVRTFETALRAVNAQIDLAEINMRQLSEQAHAFGKFATGPSLTAKGQPSTAAGRPLAEQGIVTRPTYLNSDKLNADYQRQVDRENAAVARDRAKFDKSVSTVKATKASNQVTNDADLAIAAEAKAEIDRVRAAEEESAAAAKKGSAAAKAATQTYAGDSSAAIAAEEAAEVARLEAAAAEAKAAKLAKAKADRRAATAAKTAAAAPVDPAIAARAQALAAQEAAEAKRNAEHRASGRISDVPVRDVVEKWDHEEGNGLGPGTRKLAESREKLSTDVQSLYKDIEQVGKVIEPIHASGYFNEVRGAGPGGTTGFVPRGKPENSAVLEDGHHRAAALYAQNPDATIPVDWGHADSNPYKMAAEVKAAEEAAAAARISGANLEKTAAEEKAAVVSRNAAQAFASDSSAAIAAEESAEAARITAANADKVASATVEKAAAKRGANATAAEKAYLAGRQSSQRTKTFDMGAAEDRFVAKHGNQHQDQFVAGWTDVATDVPRSEGLAKVRAAEEAAEATRLEAANAERTAAEKRVAAASEVAAQAVTSDSSAAIVAEEQAEAARIAAATAAKNAAEVTRAAAAERATQAYASDSSAAVAAEERAEAARIAAANASTPATTSPAGATASGESALVAALNRKVKALNAQSAVIEGKLSAFAAGETNVVAALQNKASKLNAQASFDRSVESGKGIQAGLQPQIDADLAIAAEIKAEHEAQRAAEAQITAARTAAAQLAARELAAYDASVGTKKGVKAGLAPQVDADLAIAQEIKDEHKAQLASEKTITDKKRRDAAYAARSQETFDRNVSTPEGVRAGVRPQVDADLAIAQEVKDQQAAHEARVADNARFDRHVGTKASLQAALATQMDADLAIAAQVTATHQYELGLEKKAAAKRAEQMARIDALYARTGVTPAQARANIADRPNQKARSRTESILGDDEKIAQYRPDAIEAADELLIKKRMQQAAMIERLMGQEASAHAAVEASYRALALALKGAADQAMALNPDLLAEAALGMAQSRVANAEVGAQSSTIIAGDKPMTDRLSEASLVRQTAEAELAAAENILAVSTGENAAIGQQLVLARREELITSLKRQIAEAEAIGADQGLTAAKVELAGLMRLQKSEIALGVAKSSKGQQAAVNTAEANRINKLSATKTPETFFGKILGKVGFHSEKDQSATSFFGSGALTSLKYAIPSMLLFGAGSGIMKSVKEAEEFQFELTKIQSQIDATDWGGVEAGQAAYKELKKTIVDVSLATGQQADINASVGSQLLGAFKGENIGGLTGIDLVTDQLEAASKISLVTKLPVAEITDGLTAASLAFGKSFEEIGDVAIALERESGVLANQTISFIGDIAPVAKEAGFSLAEFSAIAAVAQQRSGQGGAALAESFGRVIPAIAESREKLLQLAASSDALRTPGFIQAINSSDTREILLTMAKEYKNLNHESQQFVVNLLGGRREAPKLLAALANGDVLADLTKAAEDSSGSLEERYNAVLKNISVQAARVGERFHMLAKQILDAGLGRFIEGTLKFIEVLATGFGSVFKIVGSLSDALGGIPAQILLIAAATKALQAVWQSNKVTGITNALVPGLGNMRAAGGISGAIKNGGLLNAVAPAGGQGMFARARASFNAPMAPGGIGYQSDPSMARKLGAGAGSFLPTTAVGGAAVGAAGLVAAYTFLDKRRQETEKAVEEVLAAEREFSDALFEKEGNNPETRAKASSSARDAAREEAKRQIGLATKARKNLTSWVFDVVEEDQALMAEAEALLADPKMLDRIGTINKSKGASRKLSEGFFGGPGKENIGNLREIVNRAAGDDSVVGSWVNDLKGFAGAATGGLINPDSNSLGPLQMEDIKELSKGEQDYLNNVAGIVGSDVDKIQPKVLQALLDSKHDGSKKLKEIVDNPEKYGGADGAIVKQARIALENYDKALAGDPAAKALLDEVVLPPSNSEKAKATLDQLKAGLEAGRISFGTYIAGVNDELRREKEIIDLDPANADTEFLNNYYKTLKERDAAVSKHLSTLTEININSIDSGSGTELQKQTAELEQMRRALASGNYNAEDGGKAAQDYVDLQKELLEKRAEGAATAEESIRILEGGFKIPTDVRVASIKAGIDSVTQNWTAFNEAYVKIFGETADVMLSGLVEAMEQGRLTPAQVRQIIIDRITQLQAELDALNASRTGASGLFGFIHNPLDDAKDAQAKAITDVIEGLFATLLGIGDNLLGDPGGDGSADAEKVKSDKKKIRDNAQAALEAEMGYYKALAEGDPAQQARYDKIIAQGKLDTANAMPEDTLEERDAKKAAQFGALQAGFEADRAELKGIAADRQAQFGLWGAWQEFNGDLEGAAYTSVLAAQDQINSAHGTQEMAAAEQAMLAARTRLRSIVTADRAAQFGLWGAWQEFNGDFAGAAETAVKAAQDQIDNAHGTQEMAAAQQAMLSALDRQRQQRRGERDAQFDLFSTIVARDDPVAQAKIAEAKAKDQLDDARGIEAQAKANQNLIEVQRQLASAMADARQSQFTLRQAELEAMGDEVGAARVAAQAAQAQLQEAIARGAGTAEINQLRAGTITADKAARDAIFNDKMDDYKWLLDMGQITKGQYINYLEGLKTTLIPGTKQFKDLELTIKNLKNDIGSDLQANLPTSLALPTLYEVRRLDQTGGGAAGGTGGIAGGSIGYQDNRTQDIKVYVNNGMGQDEVVQVLSDALGTNRNGFGDRRY